ncbi:MAG: phosphoribosylaminoimidazolesuccinocarboxamide synthase [Phycisphaerales bacterium]
MAATLTPLAPDLPLLRRGKVRDVYELPRANAGASRGEKPGRLLIVATDRISAFDVIMPTPITGKGRTLTAMSAWWFSFIRERKLAEAHVLSTSVADLPPGLVPPGSPLHAELEGRITIGRNCTVIPIECVVRGYLEGSGWKEYQQSGSVCGVKLPAGLRQCERLPEPIFTPATKAATGHDENVTFEHACELVGMETMHALREMSLAIYNAAAAHAIARGIIIADTKFEFGFPDDLVPRAGRIWVPPIIIDEALTPDSSRFWPAETYAPGRPQQSFDKQFLREYLETLCASGGWDKSPPGPTLPPHVVAGTQAKYAEALARLCK